MGIDVFVELKAVIGEFQAKMGEARAEMTATQKHGEGAFKGMAAIGQGALLAVGGAAVAIGVASIHMADQWEESHARLKTAVENTGHPLELYKGQVAAAGKAMEDFGFNNAATEAALANLTTATGDPTKAFDLLGVAADVARFKHVDLATAATAVAKGFEGQLKPLKALGIDLPVAASSAEKVKVANDHLAGAQEALDALLKAHPDAVNAASKSHAAYEAALKKVHDAQEKVNNVGSAGAQIIDGLRERLGGQAKAAAETFSGRMEVMKARVEDVGVQIGLKLIPIITELAGVISGIIAWFEKHRSVAIALAVAIAGPLLVAMGAFVASLFAAGGALAFITLPILAVMAVVALLSIGIFELATHWSQVWRDIKQWTADAVNWVKDHLYVLIGILGPLGPFVAAVLWVAIHWQQVWHDITQWTSDAVNAIVGFFTALWGDMTRIATAIWAAVTGFFTRIYNDVAGSVSRLWHDIAGFFQNLWADVTRIVGQTTNDVVAFFAGLPGRILLALGNIIGDLFDFGKKMLQAIVDGMGSIVGSVLDAIGGFAGKILNKVKSFFGIGSPSSVFHEIGKNLMQGLANGISQHAQLASNAVGQVSGGISGAISGDVGSWLAQAIAATGAPASWMPALARMVQLESGGNPLARNTTAAGLAAGLPQGLLQIVGGTFASYAMAGHGNVFNPVDNAIAAIRYIQSRYGSPFNIPGVFGGNYQGYDTGWGVLHPGFTAAYNMTGQNEYVLRRDQLLGLGSSGGGGVVVNLNIGNVNGVGGAQQLAEIVRAEVIKGNRGRTSSGF